MRCIWLSIAALGFAVTLSACGGGSGIDPLEVGDPERGGEIFENGGGLLSSSFCSECHSLDGTENTEAHRRAPTLQGISGRAGDRVPELSVVEYLRQSIVDPPAYTVEGFDNIMPGSYKLVISEEDIDNLVAFLLTQ